MEFDWDLENRRHVGRHHITPAEAEQVLRNDPLVVQFQERGNEERLLVLGQTDAGGCLLWFIPSEMTEFGWSQHTR